MDGIIAFPSWTCQAGSSPFQASHNRMNLRLPAGWAGLGPYKNLCEIHYRPAAFSGKIFA